MTINIFLIENQITQFEKIQTFLEAGGDIKILPEVVNEDFIIQVMDWVRVYLSPALCYRLEKKIAALENLADVIKASNSRLLLIDYHLVGNYNGSSGIDLSKDLREKHGIKIPVMFLSGLSIKSDDPSNELLNKLQTAGFTADQWMNKGFRGSGPDEGYFTYTVAPHLLEIIKASDHQLINEIMHNLIFTHANNYTALQELVEKEKLKFNEVQMKTMNDFIQVPRTKLDFETFASDMIKANAS